MSRRKTTRSKVVLAEIAAHKQRFDVLKLNVGDAPVVKTIQGKDYLFWREYGV